jgi:hypothetical protein
MAEGEDGLWHPIDVNHDRESATSRPDGSVVIRAELVVNTFPTLLVEYPDIGRFFVPDGTEDPESQPVAVISVNGDGTARLKSLEVDGEPWP